jgi:hypothetical protein
VEFAQNVKPAVTITGFTPASGPVGTSVTLTGTNFTGVSAVAFNGTPTSNYTVHSSTSITVIVPAGATSGLIGVAASLGIGVSSIAFTVTSGTPAPAIYTYSPGIGPIGSQVIIGGVNFKNVSAVAFNGVATSNYTVNAQETQIIVTVPNGARSGLIGVAAAGGIAVTAASFTVNPMVAIPAIAAFSPTSGPSGSQVVVNGVNFNNVVAVAFNGTPTANYTVLSPTQIIVTVPAGATTGLIGVAAAGGVAISSNVFTVNAQAAAPAIASFTPASGPVGSQVVIDGVNFANVDAVAINGTATTNFSVLSPTQIIVAVPLGATTGLIGVATPGGVAASNTFFTVRPGIATPALASVAPASGPIGSQVVINGVNFNNVVAVAFNGTPTANYTVLSPTQIIVTVPAGATTGLIGVAAAGGVAISDAVFTIRTGLATPVIATFGPIGGVAGSQAVIIMGANFLGTNAVAFNGVATSNFTIISSTQLTVTVPSAATSGPIGVATPGGVAISTASFVVTAASGANGQGRATPARMANASNSPSADELDQFFVSDPLFGSLLVQ